MAPTRSLALRVACALLAGGALALTCGAQAQPAPSAPPDYPNHPLRMIVPAATGGGVDTVARLIGAKLAQAVGQAVVIDNRPGAGTMLASELTAHAAPDGYTLLMMTSSHAVNAGLHADLRYQPVDDFSTVSFVTTLPYLLVVHPSVPARNPRQLIDLARSRPGQLSFASAGAGSGTHLAAELFVAMANIRMVHVPYKGGSPALVDVAGGHVQLMFSNIINCMPYVRSKRLNALAITTPQPSPLYPALPTIAASGLPGYAADTWYGVVTPARVPVDIVARLNREINAILRTVEVREKLAAQGGDAAGSTPQAFNELLREEIQKWGKITATLHMQM